MITNFFDAIILALASNYSFIFIIFTQYVNFLFINLIKAFWLQGPSNELLVSQILHNPNNQQNKENLSYDQMKDKKLLHRNQIIVEVHNQNNNNNGNDNNNVFREYDSECNSNKNEGSEVGEVLLNSNKFGCDDDDDIEMKYYERSRRFRQQKLQQQQLQQQQQTMQKQPQQPPIRPTTLNLTG